MMKNFVLQFFKNNLDKMMIFLFIMSMGICFFTFGLFRILDIKIFLAVLFVVSSIYCIFKKYPRVKSFCIQGNWKQLTIACVLECFLFVDFSSYILQVSPASLQKLPFSPTVTAIVIAIVCCIASFLFLFELSVFIKGLFNRLGCILLSYKSSFLLLSAVYLLGMTAIIRADFAYYDDMYRIMNGLDMTGDFSRHTATFLSNFLHGSTRLSDISPLPQILAVLVIALTGILLLYIFDDACGKQKKFDLWRVISLIPLCFSPYFLACLSYKFDSPYMAASVLFSVLPLLYHRASAKKYILAVGICSILMCTTYQASSGIFPTLVLLLSYLMWNRKENLKKIGSFILRSICGYASGLLIFRFLIMTEVDTYVDSALSLKSVPGNLFTYFNTFVTCFTPVWISLLIITCITFLIAMTKKSKQHPALALPITLLTLACMAVLSFGVYLIFSRPLLSVRSMYGFCVFLTLLGIVITTVVRVPVAKTSVFLFSWLMFVFSFTYGNALSQQKDYIDFRLQEVVCELNQIDALESNQEVYVQIIGNIGYCDSVQGLASEYKVLNELVPTGFSDAVDDFGEAALCYYQHLNLIYDETIDMTQMDLPVKSDTVYHTIKSKDNYLLIYLK